MQNTGAGMFPVIQRLDTRDAGFRQFISDVENNRRRLFGSQRNPQELVEFLTIFQYIPREGEDIFFLAARSNIPYATLVSLNRIYNPSMLEAGEPLLLPSMPGIFMPAVEDSSFDLLLDVAIGESDGAVPITIRTAGRPAQLFYFFPGRDFTSAERVAFRNMNFSFPLRSFRLTSPFGMRRNPITGNFVHHRGIDLAAPRGTPVYAAADGVVTRVGRHHLYGNYVLISHAGRWTTFYAHLDRIDTSLNERVRAGSIIGRVGSTGQSTGPHLHFEMHHYGIPVNPSGRLRSL
ncbi:MAG: M23 family metallopeptidase [Spirochaetes bacterium]|nr:M23 family metallopeptidase [Spirochaetota bacterium]